MSQSESPLLIVLWSCGPDRPGGATLMAAPLIYALTARAMDQPVEVHFTSSTVRWLIEAVAQAAHTDQRRSRTVAALLDEVQAAGVSLQVCAMARAEHVAPGELLRAGVQAAGAATVVAATLSSPGRVLVF